MCATHNSLQAIQCIKFILKMNKFLNEEDVWVHGTSTAEMRIKWDFKYPWGLENYSQNFECSLKACMQWEWGQ